MKNRIIEALKEVETDDFVVNDELIDFIEEIPAQTHYFLFGTNAIDDFNENPEEVDLSGVRGVLFTFKDGDNPADLLDAFLGWEAYQVLTPEQYKQIADYNAEDIQPIQACNCTEPTRFRIIENHFWNGDIDLQNSPEIIDASRQESEVKEIICKGCGLPYKGVKIINFQ